MSLRIETAAEFDAALEQGPYAFPGGYPLYFVMADGEPLSYKAASAEAARIREALEAGASGDRDWRPLAMDINYEDADLTCVHTGEAIECAYPPDAAPAP